MMHGDNAVLVCTQSSTFILPVYDCLLYGSETWTLGKCIWAKDQAFRMRCQHRILSIKWNDFTPNVTVATTSCLDSIINIVRARQLGLFGDVARFSRDVPASNILTICCASGDGYMDILTNLPGGA